MASNPKPPRIVLGEYDVRGIPISVWITREPSYDNEITNFLNAENKQYELKYKSEIHAMPGRNSTHPDELTDRIKQAHADGNLSITLYDHKNLFVTTNNPIYKKQVIFVLHSCIGYHHIQDVLYKKQIAELEEKNATLEAYVAELEAKIATLEAK
jgi:hypothetical protein